MKNKILEKAGIRGKVICKLYDLQGNLIEEKVYDNLVMNLAKNFIAGIFNGEAPYTGFINYGAVGTDTTAVNAAQTQLVAELGRNLVNTQSRASNVTTISWYYSPTQVNGNLKEFGAFYDATATANSGQMFDRVLIDVVKTSLTSLTIDLVITIS